MKRPFRPATPDPDDARLADGRPEVLGETEVYALPFDPPLWWNRSHETRRAFTRAVRAWEASRRRMPPPTHQQFLRDRLGVAYRKAVEIRDPDVRASTLAKIADEWRAIAGFPKAVRSEAPPAAPPPAPPDLSYLPGELSAPAVEDWLATPAADDPTIPF